MPTDIRALPRDVLDDVREACEKSGRPTTDAEVRRALEACSADEVDAVRLRARAPLEAGPLGPDALVDIIRGTAPQIASARELGGYYAMKAERDALARITRQLRPEPGAPSRAEVRDEEPGYEEEGEEEGEEEFAEDEAEVHAEPRDEGIDGDDERPAPPDLLVGEKPVPRPRPFSPKGHEEEIQKLVTLFAYHRDAVRVAQELGLGIGELNDRLEMLGLRRKIHRLLEQTTDIEVFSPEALGVSRTAAGTAVPVVRKRSERPTRAEAPAAEPEPAHGGREEPAARTTPVNAHGTRVYRRAETTPRPAEPAGPLATRREYVRETRRKPKAVARAKEPAPKAEPVAPPAPATASKRPFSELQSPGGAAVLERLLADEKANPRVLATKLGERFAGPADRALNESDLRALIQHHGLAPTFQERETANTRFLIGFHQGARSKLANALQMTPAELGGYLSRLGLSEDLERTRAERSRVELGRRRIHDRIVQVLTRAPYLDDLGVLGVIDREVREHLEQLVEAHKANGERGEKLVESARAELGIEPNAFNKLLRRYDLTDRIA